MNGTNNNDRTTYFEVLPKNQLDLALNLESNRMRALAVNPENLDSQRNACRKSAGLAWAISPVMARRSWISTNLAFESFAYKYSVISEMSNPNVATLEDVPKPTIGVGLPPSLL